MRTTRRVVLITGAAGFIGGYAATRFRAEGWEVLGIDRAELDGGHPSRPECESFYRVDLIDTESVKRVLRAHRPHVCVHLGGPANVQRSFEDPVSDFSSQMLPLLHLLDAIRCESPETRFLLVSSAAVYGNPAFLPVCEGHTLAPISPYGFHKREQELLVDEYGQLYGLRACKARAFSTYGPGMRQLAVWDIATRALSNDYTLYGTGEETRDYLFVGDVAAALCAVASKGEFAGEAINVASGCETSLMEIAERIYAELGVTVRPQPCPELKTAGNPVRWRADVSVLRSLGFSPAAGLEHGIGATVRWVRKQCLVSA